MFIIEVKNWAGEVMLDRNGVLTRKGSTVTNNLAARMTVKEFLLREHLGDLFPECYRNVLLFPEERTVFKDEYHRIEFSYGAGISNYIKFSAGPKILSDEQICQIVERIGGGDLRTRTRCDVRCDEIIQDYAELMARMEAASAGEERGLEVTVKATVELPFEKDDVKVAVKRAARGIEWKRIGKAAAGATLAVAIGYLAGRALKKA